MAVKIRYTAARSGHAAIVIPGLGLFKTGDVREVATKEEAERITAPAEDGKSDWELVASQEKAADAAGGKD